jgi:hypothetical protein
MSKPIEPERIENENATEEKKTAIITSEEVVNPSVEESVEKIIVADENPAPEDLVETLPEKEDIAEPDSVAEDEETAVPDKEPLVSEEKKATAPSEKEAVDREPEPFPAEKEVEKEIEKETEEGIDKLSKNEIVDQLAVLVNEPLSESCKNKIDALKQVFYKSKKIETDNARQAFILAGGTEEEFVPETDEWEEKLKELLAVFREKKGSLVAETEKTKEENLENKKAILEKLKTLIESREDFYKIYSEFRKLQQQWKEIKPVPQTSVNELWKEYQHYTEKFYDLLKINNEMRDYDFKKNMELKQTLCDAVERLADEKDIISAFYQLQKLHLEWREIGPVAKEFREELWSRFKKASSIINKKHQEHFESLRSMEHRNLEEKIALCEEMEAIDYAKMVTFKEWNEQNKRVLELQEKWKTIGFAPKKNNIKVFERFRAACDVFFAKKGEFYKSIKEAMETNLEKKKLLCETAEALKDSQEWKETSDKLINLQKEWKTIGQAPRKYSDAIWKRFITACDYFFEQKNIHSSSQKNNEIENLKKKKDIIAQIEAIDEALAKNEAIAQIRELTLEFNNTGYVPFKEKDKIYKEYREAIDKHFDRLKIDESERRLQSFKSNLGDLSGGEGKSKNKLLSEREKLMRTYERLKGDIQTYENNIGFLSVSSKGGGGLLREMNRKIDALKEELDLIVKKIEIIDDSLGFGK